MDRKFILEKHAELRAMRQPEEAAWSDIAEVLAPEEAQFSGKKTKADYGAIFDSTPLYAHDDFVSGLFGQATNPANQWFLLGHEDQELMGYKPVKDWLSRSTSVLAYTFQPAVSPFYAEASAWFGDVGAFGNGGLCTEEDTDGRFLDKSIPLHELFWERNLRGDVETVHREFCLSRRMAAKKFGNVPGLDDGKPGEIKIIHAVFPNEQHNPRKIDSKPLLSIYISPDVQALERRSGYYEMPYHIPLWSRGIGPHYGRGPGHRARADMRMLNEMERAAIVAAQFAAEPPIMLHHDTELTAADIIPNALLYGSISAEGRELARPLHRAQNLQLSLQQSEQRRKSIRDAFYFSMMQVVNRPQMTATEVLGYKEENLRLMGPNLARLQVSGLSPLIARRFAILQRRNVLPPPPPELEGQPLAIQYVSPLALAQKASDGRAVLQLWNATMQMAQAKPEVLDNFNEDAAFAVLHDAYGAAANVMRDPREVDENRQARGAQQARMSELEAASQEVNIAATASHAAQAASAAGGRRA